METKTNGRGRPRGQPKTGGRKPGTLNKVTADIKAMAGEYGERAIQELARLATNANNEQTRVSACKEILDRAYGKAPQSLEHSGRISNKIEEEVSDLEVARTVAFLLTNATEKTKAANNSY